MATEENTRAHPMENHATSITPDVIEEILLRLPVSSLLRFSRMCHQWCDIIRDPRFIMDHANRAPEHLLLFLPRVDISAGLKTLKPGRATIFDEKWSPSTWKASSMDPDDHLFASCNGLLCFYRKYTLKIANPVTGQCLYLSKPDGILLHDFYYLYSFGFDPTTGEYKLIHFLREPRHYKSGQPFRFDVIQVYTLGEDKWRDIRAPRSCCLVHLGVVNVDRAMYWLTEEEGTSCGVAVMQFDLKEERFASIQPPPLKVCETEATPCETSTLSYYITEVDKKVCLVTTPFHSHVPRWRRFNAELFGRMDIWMLESQTDHKWLLKYSIDLPSTQRYVPQPCFIHREKILLHDRDGNAFCHDLEGKNSQIEHSREAKLLNFRPYRYYETQSYFYKETLVPLDVYAGAAILRSPPCLLHQPCTLKFL